MRGMGYQMNNQEHESDRYNWQLKHWQEAFKAVERSPESLPEGLTLAKVEELYRCKIDTCKVIHRESRKLITLFDKMLKVMEEKYIDGKIKARCSVHQSLMYLRGYSELKYLLPDRDLEYVNKAIKYCNYVYEVFEKAPFIGEGNLLVRLFHIIRIKLFGLTGKTVTRKAVFEGYGENILIEYRALGLRAQEHQGRITVKGLEHLKDVVCNTST